MRVFLVLLGSLADYLHAQSRSVGGFGGDIEVVEMKEGPEPFKRHSSRDLLLNTQ